MTPKLLLLCRATLGAVALGAAAPVLAIVGGSNTSAFGQVGTSSSGSNVQIAPNWVLTAHHVGYAVGTSYQNGYGSSTVAARYNLSSNAFPEDDLSLLRLGSAIAAPALTLRADVIADGVFAGIDATVVTGHNQSPRGYAFVELREASRLADADGPGPKPAVVANYVYSFGLATDGPYVQGGDSGGALFLGHVTDSSSLLMGITSAQVSYTDAGITRFGSAFVQLAAYRSWIDATMAADATDHEVARWLSAVPEPTTDALWLGGLALLAAARRRPAGAQAPARSV